MQKITERELTEFGEKYEGSRSNRIAQHAVTSNGIYKSAENMQAIDRNQSNNWTFSVDIDSEGVANQRKSGRCWMFAALNTLRHHIMKKYDVDSDFELSENYTFFYDKIEKCNYFYNEMIELADRPLSDRSVQFWLQMPQQDGGDWCLIAAVIDKYGVVPKDQMGETSCSITSAELDTILNRKLRKDALELRKLAASGATAEKISVARTNMLEEDYRILAIALGVPPQKITFEYRDTNKKFHQSGWMSPKEFYTKFIGLDLNDYVGLMNVPDPSMPYGKVYGVEMSGNMVGGRPNRYLNVPMEDMKKAAIAQIEDGEPCWFGCDVLQQFDREKGIMDLDLYGFNDLFDVDFDMDKADMFNLRESLPTHAMVLGGVDLREGKPVRWKVENSWGPDHVGDKGYMIMSDAWMDKYTYEIVVNKKYLTNAQRAAFDAEPTILPFWNAMNPVAA